MTSTARGILVLAGLCLAVNAGSTLRAEEWGNLKGRFVYDAKAPAPEKIQAPGIETKKPLLDESLLVDPKTGGVANVVVFLRTKDVAEHPDYAKTANDNVLYDSKDFRFVPRIMTARLSQTIVLGNSDAVTHNTNFQPIGDLGLCPLIPAGGALQYNSTRQQNIPQPVGCNIHAWMKGYILVRKSPYMAVTGNDGSFEIENLPTQELEFQVWHERTGFLAAKPGWGKGRFNLAIRPGAEATDLGTIKLDPKLFEVKERN